MSNDIRSSAEINSIIDSINANAEASGTPVDGGELQLLTLEAKAADAIAKYRNALAQRANSAKYDAIAKGDTVKFDFGRGEKVRELTGVVTHREGDKLAVLTGEGLEQKSQIISVTQVKVS